MSAGPILVLYWNPYGVLREAVARHLSAVAAVADPDDVLAVNAAGGAPRLLARLRPSGIVLHTTYLAARWLGDFDRWRERGSWIGDLDVPKVALPQDDYDHADVLDEWLAELGVTAVLSPLADHLELYPLTRRRATVRPVLTGYVDEFVTQRLMRTVPPWGSRRTDVVYRASALPYWYGRHGQLKREIAEAAANAASRNGWRADISTTEVIAGPRWLDHLASGRVVVGCEGGSSVLDRRGEVRRRIETMLGDRPDASFDEIDALMGSSWDSSRFVALSPRHLEAALTRTCQVLVQGRYSGVLEAGKHYVPVAADLSDVDDAITAALDPDVALPMIERSWADLVDSGSWGYPRLTQAVSAELPVTPGAVPAWARVHGRILGGSVAARRVGRTLLARVNS